MHVVEVKGYPTIKRYVTTAADLPEAGDSGRNARDKLFGATDLRGLDGQVRPGTDQAHLSLEHVPELRQLVEAGLAQQTPDPGHARVVLQFSMRFELFAERWVFE